jgi:DNA-binding XRE family transcriptional regulator
LGVTQWATAKLLGVDPDSVRNWETGRTSIDVRYYPALITFLRYNPLAEPTSHGKAIQRTRMTLGLSRKRPAALAGIDAATVKRIEHDMPRRAVRARRAICAVLGL